MPALLSSVYSYVSRALQAFEEAGASITLPKKITPSSDRSETESSQYYATTMPWLAVPYDATRMRHQQISMRYGFQGNVIAIEEALWINVIRHDKKKPGGLDKVLKHFGIRSAY